LSEAFVGDVVEFLLGKDFYYRVTVLDWWYIREHGREKASLQGDANI
jgi:hypothetical protein